jgi:hypothetical protein
MPNLFDGQYKDLAQKGRYGDTMLAHINPQEAALLKSMGGAGTINPQTGLREFYGNQYLESIGYYGKPEPSPAYGTTDFYALRSGGVTKKPDPFPRAYADIQQGGMGVQTITGYTVPSERKFADIPLVGKYEPTGKFTYYTLEPGKYLTPDPSQPNIRSNPRFDANGEVIDWGIVDISKQRGDGFGDFLGGLVEDFGPMILASLGAQYLAGSGLFTGAGAAGAGNAGALINAGMGGSAAQAASAAANLATTSAGLNAAVAAGGGLVSGAGANFLNPSLISTAGGAGGELLTSGLTTAEIAAAAEAAAAAGGTTAGATAAEIAAAEKLAAETLAASNISGGLTTDAVTRAAAAAAAGAGSTITPSILQSIADATGISVDTLKTFGPSVIQGLVGLTGSVISADKATDAATTQANAITEAARIAADAARFRPVGVTTRFGTSNFTTDEKGNVVTAGYTPSAEITGYQDRLKTLAGQGLTDVEAARAAYQPLTGAAQSLFGLGQSYLAKTPEQAAADYISKQQALLAPSQENQLAQLQNKLFQQGRGGAATAQGGNLMATNPEMAAYYNSLAQSNLALAAQADQEAQNRIRFGAGLFDTGAGLQGKYYAGQTAAYAPFTTAMDTSTALESLAQVPLTLGTQIGAQTTASAANAGRLTSEGITSAARTMAPANAYSAAGNLFTGAAQSPVFSNAVNRAFGNTQQSTQQTFTFNPATGQYIPVQNAII